MTKSLMCLSLMSVCLDGDIMATFNSFAAFEQQIIKDMQTAATRAKDKIERELFLNVNDYYAGSAPKKYIRTGTLLTSPDSTPVQGSGKSLSFSVYMNDGISYNTGSFSGAQVIDATEYGLARTVGKHGYFGRTEESVDDILESEFNNL